MATLMNLGARGTKRQTGFAWQTRIVLFAGIALAIGTITHRIQKSDLNMRQADLLDEIDVERGIGDDSVTAVQKKRGDEEWVALGTVYRENEVPIFEPNLSPANADFIGKDVMERATRDEKLKHDIGEFFRIRNAVLPSQEDELKAEDHLIWHIKKALETIKKAAEIDEERKNLPKTHLAVGAIIFAILELIYRIVTLPGKIRAVFQNLSGIIRGHLRKRSWILHIERREEERQRQKRLGREEREAKRQSVDKAGTSRKTASRREDTTITTPRMELAEPAREALTEKVGADACGIIFTTLGDRISSRILRGIINGDYPGLVGLLKKYGSLFEGTGLEVSGVIQTLTGEAPVTKRESASPIVKQAPTRRRHELDDISRWGWRPTAFHQLLRRYGFDTSEPTGGGHFFVKFRGEKVRQQDGRAVLVTSRTSGTEVTPGVADCTLNACANLLVRIEDEQMAKGDGRTTTTRQ